jgi:hypothetical protein
LSVARPDRPMQRRRWVLNTAAFAYGLAAFDLLIDPSWWH